MYDFLHYFVGQIAGFLSSCNVTEGIYANRTEKKEVVG
jgi:hypothetical protein